MNKILIIGSSGQLGNELKKILSKSSILLTPLKQELDINNINEIPKYLGINKPDVIINCAAYHVLKDCEMYPEQAFKTNGSAHLPFIEYCNFNNKLYISYSSDYVFDGKLGSSYKESAKPNPLQIYGMSRFLGEQIIQKYCTSSFYIIRTCGLYGINYSKSRGGNFISKCINQIKLDKNIKVSSEMIISPTYCVDLAESTIKLILSNANSGIYHLVNEGSCTWYDFASLASKLYFGRNYVNKVTRSLSHDGFLRPEFSALKNIKAKKMGILLPSWDAALKIYILEFLKSEKNELK